VQEVESHFGLRCIAILSFSELIGALALLGPGAAGGPAPPSPAQLEAMRVYRQRYGVASG
jgi:hypothetical protein